MNLGEALAQILLAEINTLGEDVLFRNKQFKAQVSTSDQLKAMEIGGYFENQSLQIIFPKYTLINLASRPRINEVIQVRGNAFRIHSVRVMESEHGYDLTTELIPDYPLIDNEGGLIPNRPSDISSIITLGRPKDVIAEIITKPNSVNDVQTARDPLAPSEINAEAKYIDLYLIAGQSNAHGHSAVIDLSEAQSSDISVGFYTSWHENTSDATTEQYYTNYKSSMVLGETRGEGTSSSLDSSNFGIEWGFAKKIEELNTESSEIGIIKYAVGASSIDDSALSDWDLNKDNECWQGLKNTLANAIATIKAEGKNARWKGLVWYQGESNSNTPSWEYKAKLIELISAIETELDIASLSAVFCAPASATGTDLQVNNAFTSLARSKNFYNYIKISEYHDGINNNVHLSAQNMYDAGIAVGNAMALAVASTATEVEFSPDVTQTKLWVDADDSTMITADSTTNVLEKIVSKSDNVVTDFYPQTNDSNHTPTVIVEANAIANRNCLTFSDNREFVQSDGQINMTNKVQDWFIVAKPNINHNQDSIWATELGRAITLIPLTGNLFKWYYGGTPATDSFATTDQSDQLGLYQIRWHTSGDHTSTWFNGVQINSQRAFGADISFVKIQHQFMAQYGTTPLYTNDGKFCEAIATTELSNRKKIEGYLAHKWGITLPINHEYRYYAP